MTCGTRETGARVDARPLRGDAGPRQESHQLWPLIGDDERRAVARVLDRGSSRARSRRKRSRSKGVRRVRRGEARAAHPLGTSALLVALAAAGVRAGDEVIVPAYSFVATPLSVVHVGAIPVFADVDVETGCIDPAAAAAAVTPRTRAIMPVHMHGCAADMRRAARRRAAPRSRRGRGRGAGARGEVEATGASAPSAPPAGFSLQSSKNLSAGEGGLFVTNDDAIAEEAIRSRNFGQDVSRAERGRSTPRARSTARARSTRGGSARCTAATRSWPPSASAPSSPACASAPSAASETPNGWPGPRELPGVTPPRVPAGRRRCTTSSASTSTRGGGARSSPRDSSATRRIQALRAEGLEVVLWQSAPLPAQTSFRGTIRSVASPPPRGGHRPRDNYDPAAIREPARLDGSVVLFSAAFVPAHRADR